MSKNLQTGDLLFFYGDSNSVIDKMIMEFTNSPYSHVVMIIKNPTFISEKGTFCLQSISGKETAIEQNERRSGVILTPFSELQSSKYDIRHLTTDRDEAFYKKLEQAHALVHNLPYDFSILDWVRTGLYSIGLTMFATPRHTNNFWCSALVAYVYKEMGLLPKDTDWSNQTPGSLATTKDIVAPNQLGPLTVKKLG